MMVRVCSNCSNLWLQWAGIQDMCRAPRTNLPTGLQLACVDTCLVAFHCTHAVTVLFCPLCPHSPSFSTHPPPSLPCTVAPAPGMYLLCSLPLVPAAGGVLVHAQTGSASAVHLGFGAAGLLGASAVAMSDMRSSDLGELGVKVAWGESLCVGFF